LASPSVTGELAKAGVTFEIRDGRLRVAPAANMTPELVALVREHKDQLARIARFRETVDGYKREHNILEPEGVPGPPIESVGEVFEMARAILNPTGIVYDPPPPPPAPPGRDPMVRTNTDKARLFRGVRDRDLEKRSREGVPSWIRVVDGGAA